MLIALWLVYVCPHALVDPSKRWLTLSKSVSSEQSSCKFLVFLLELTPAADALQDTMTPLHNAAHMGQPEAVKALLEAKAMANIRLVRSELEFLIHDSFDHPRLLAHEKNCISFSHHSITHRV